MAKTRDFEFIIDGMMCAACIDTVQTNAKKVLNDAINLKKPSETDSLNSIKRCAATLPNELLLSLAEDYPLTDTEIYTLLSTSLGNLGYGCAYYEKLDPTKFRNHLIKGTVGIVIGFGMMFGMALMMMAGFGMPAFLLLIEPYLPYILGGLSTLLTLYLGHETYVDAFKKLFLAGKLNMNTLFTVSTFAAIGSSIASFFTDLPNMFSDALLIFGFRHIGIAIEEKAKQNVFTGLKFRQRAAKKVRKVYDKKTNTDCDIECNTEDLIEGDIIYVCEKQVIPVDGICLIDDPDQHVSVYDSINSGATTPKTLKNGDEVLAGMDVPLGGNQIKIKVTAKETHSQLARLDRQIKQSQTDEKRQAPLQTTADAILKWFVPAVILLAAIGFVAAGFLSAPIGGVFAVAIAFKIAATILVSACPCTLGFIVQLIVRAGIMKGVDKKTTGKALFKSSESLQAASNIKHIVLDVNGTITTGKPAIKNFKKIPSDMTQEDIFDMIGLLEKGSNHPVAKALCDYIKNVNYVSSKKLTVDTDEKKKEKRNDFQCGRSAVINGATYTIGDCEAMKKRGVNISHLQHLYDEDDVDDVIYLAKDNQLIAYVTIHSPLRADAEASIQKLKAKGYDISLATGLNERSAYRIAKKIGVECDANHIFWGCESKEPADGKDYPEKHKVSVIHKKQQTGRVAFVGDGANDFRAIQDGIFNKEQTKCCDVGIAIESETGSLLTQQNASIIASGLSLKSLVNVFTIAEQTVHHIKYALIFSFGYNAAIMIGLGVLIGLGLSSAIIPAVGVCLMFLQAFIVIGIVKYFQHKSLDDKEVEMTSHIDTKPSSSSVSKIAKDLDLTPALSLVKVDKSTDKTTSSTAKSAPGFSIQAAAPAFKK